MKIKSGLGITRQNTGVLCLNCKGYGQFTRSKRITRNICGDDTKFFKDAWVETCRSCSGSGCWRPPVPGVKYEDGQQVRMGDILYLDYSDLIWGVVSWYSQRACFIMFADGGIEDLFEFVEMGNYASGTSYKVPTIENKPLGSVYSAEIQGNNEGESFNFCDTEDFKQFQAEFQTKIKLWEE